jgi:hypothetical protein
MHILAEFERSVEKRDGVCMATFLLGNQPCPEV